MTEQELLRLARVRMAEQAADTSRPVSEGAVRLLAELYLVGLRHGVSPADWASVTSLPVACLDATRARERRDRRFGQPQTPVRQPERRTGPRSADGR